MTSVQGKSCLPKENRVSKTFTSPSSYKSNDRDHKDLLGSNKPPARPLQAPFPTSKDPSVNWYSQQDLD